MGKIYLSVSSKTREGGFKELGISGKSRKLQKVYLSVIGKTRLVWQNYVPVTEISLSCTYSGTLVVSCTVTASFTPSNATNPRITNWALSSNGVSSNISIKSTSDTTCVLSPGDSYSSSSKKLTATCADGTSVTYVVKYSSNKSWTISKV